MDVNQTVPSKLNDGSRGVDWLGPDRDGVIADDEYVLQVVAECEDWPDDHPYKQQWQAKITEGGIAVKNPADLLLIVAACNSYDKHCGERAVECAEADLLGELLAACKLARDTFSTFEWEDEAASAVSHTLSELCHVIAKAEPASDTEQ